MAFSSRKMLALDWAKIRYFKPSEFRSPEKMGYEFMQWLDMLRQIAAVPIVITSSYRSDAYNKSIGGALDSAHTDEPCDAVDIGMRPRKDDLNWNYTRYQIVASAIKLGCRRIGTYADGSLHLDMSHSVRPAPRMWRIVGSEKVDR